MPFGYYDAPPVVRVPPPRPKEYAATPAPPPRRAAPPVERAAPQVERPAPPPRQPEVVRVSLPGPDELGIIVREELALPAPDELGIDPK